jgi:hypothetical protein
MKHRLTQLVVCAAIALFAVPATARADQRPFQLMLGAVFAHMKFDDPKLDSSWRGNIVFGADFGVPLFPKDSKVQLRGELLLVPRGGNVEDGQFLRKVKLLYIDAAGLVDVELKDSFHLLAGTSVGFRVGSAASVDGLGVDIAGVFRPLDVGITFGADVVVVPKRIRMQVLYTHGLMNILSDETYSPFLDNFFNTTGQAKNQTLLIMIAPGFWK